MVETNETSRENRIARLQLARERKTELDEIVNDIDKEFEQETENVR